MRRQLLSMAIVGVFSLGAQAQLPSERFSAINYIGRFAGFGYSDGYHACKDDRCTSFRNRETWQAALSPTMVPQPRSVLVRPSTVTPQYSQQVVVDPTQPTQPMRSPEALPMPMKAAPTPASQPSPSDIRKPEGVPAANQNESLPSPPSVPQSMHRPTMLRHSQ